LSGDFAHPTVDVQPFGGGVIVWQDQRVHFRHGQRRSEGTVRILRGRSGSYWRLKRAPDFMSAQNEIPDDFFDDDGLGA